MLLRLTQKTALHFTTGDSLLDVFRARTSRLVLYSITILFVEIGLLHQRDRGY